MSSSGSSAAEGKHTVGVSGNADVCFSVDLRQ